MFTTADLPPDMIFDPENPTARAVKGSALSVTCRHGDPKCPRCITAEARRVIDASPVPPLSNA